MQSIKGKPTTAAGDGPTQSGGAGDESTKRKAAKGKTGRTAREAASGGTAGAIGTRMACKIKES
ncbi:hypothetical protein [Salinispora oceanensis]|uniref:hypothetical protein n=1 Tax=Salinispora oceanensis TaxID=1050199 RepID=UPI0003A697AD|nr:hypothetical protein [Salinispora oceanensis]